MEKIKIILLCLCLSLSLTHCSSEPEKPKTAEEKQKALNNTFMAAPLQNVKAAHDVEKIQDKDAERVKKMIDEQ